MSDYQTPEQAEAAFYQAFEQADLKAMMALWADLEEVACVHPMGPFLRGREAIHEGWRSIFSDGPKMRFHLDKLHYHLQDDLAVHNLIEYISLRDSAKPPTPVLTTNVYRRIENTWRMVLHHASLSPDSLLQRASEQATVLH